MRSSIRTTLVAIGSLAGAGVLALGVGYLAAGGVPPLSATVVDDPSLPAIDIGGVRLHAEARGEPGNPLVVVLHGGPGDDYRALLPLAPLADDYRVVFYDQRGAGLSERVPPEALGVSDYVAELDETGSCST